MAAYKELTIDEHNYNWVKYADVLLQHSVEQYRLTFPEFFVVC